MSKVSTAPPKDELYRLIHVQHLSYREVAQMFGVHMTTVPYWLKRYGLDPADWKLTRYRGDPPRLTPSEARQRYESGESAASIAHSAGFKSKTSVLRMLDDLGVERRSKGWQPTRWFTAADGTAIRSHYELRVADWLTAHLVEYEYEPALPFGHHRSSADFLANGWYIEVWGVNSSKAYAKRKAQKQKMYARHALPLIELAPHHFSRRGAHILERRLEQALQVP